MDRIKEIFKNQVINAETYTRAAKIRREIKAGMQPVDILKYYLPAGDSGKLENDCAELFRGIQEYNNECSREMTADEVKQRINNSISGFSDNKAGRTLVSMVAAVSPELKSNGWTRLQNASEYSADDVETLKQLLQESIESGAGVMKDAFFEVMEPVMGRLSPEMARQQMAQGEEFTRAFTMSCYIQSQLGHPLAGIDGKVSPYLMGMTCAMSAKSNELAAKYKLGMLRMKDLLCKIAGVMKTVLLHTVIHALNYMLLRCTIPLAMSIGLFVAKLLPGLPGFAILACFLSFAFVAADFMDPKNYRKEVETANRLLEAISSAVHAMWDKVTAFFRRRKMTTAASVSAVTNKTNTNVVSNKTVTA